MTKVEVDEVKKMNIYERLSAITDELGVVAKNLNISMTYGKSYKAVGERDVLDAVKPLEKKYRIYSYPASRTDLCLNIENKNVIRITTVYRFVNIDKPDEYIDITSYGDGIDSGDKATGKAMTYADKYALMKAYKISTGDDPDQEASPEPQEAVATAEQVAEIRSLVDSQREARILKAYKKEKLEDVREVDAQAILRKLKSEKKKEA